MANRKEAFGGGGPIRKPNTDAMKGFSSSDRFLTVLARTNNPDTGKPHTDLELASIFGYSPEKVSDILVSVGMREPPKIPFSEVRHEAVPENEMAFFTGMGLGDFQVKQVHYGEQTYVTVATEASSERKRSLLKATLGTWGETKEVGRELKVYVASPGFNFMENPSVDSDFLRAKIRFAPFMLGLMAARLSGKENRLSLSNEKLLERIHKGFEQQFGFSPGNYRVEPRRNEPSVPVIQVKDPGKVFSALLEVESVRRLPYLADIAKISSGQNGNGLHA